MARGVWSSVCLSAVCASENLCGENVIKLGFSLEFFTKKVAKTFHLAVYLRFTLIPQKKMHRENGNI